MSQFHTSSGSPSRGATVVAEVPAGTWTGHARGQILVLVAMLIIALMGFVALATDVGLLWSERVQMQTATDAAAVAAASALRSGANVTSAAQNVATINGFTNGTHNATVAVS